jgi:N6-adenosine-specific RNA methylase IME4
MVAEPNCEPIACHSISNIFPLLSEAELAELAADIRENGLLQPIFLYDGKILDGRNRYQACQLAGVQPRFEQFKGDDPLAFVISANLRRRHLNESQRGLIARRLATMRQGSRTDLQHSANLPEVSQDKAAEMMNVSPRTVRTVTAVEREAPDLIPQIEKGELSATGAMRALKERKREAAREENQRKIDAAETIDEALKAAKFSTIVLDPPWDYADEGDVDQLGRARPQYQTMTIDELVKFPVGDFADENCHIYCWITNRSLLKGALLLDAWGFRYVTCLTWCKKSFGMGTYFRGSTEHVLFGVRGSLPLKRKNVGTWFAAPRGTKHSSKPDEFFKLVESCSPGPRLELFARAERKGWTCWGGEHARKAL